MQDIPAITNHALSHLLKVLSHMYDISSKIRKMLITVDRGTWQYCL